MRFLLILIALPIVIGIMGGILESIKDDIEMKISYKKEREEREKRFAKIPLNERKCSKNCKYAYNLKKYRNGNQELIGAECKYNSFEMINGFYVRGKGKGEFVWEKDHVGCENYDCFFSSFL